MYSDASGKIGFGALCGSSWMYGRWGNFLSEDPSIEYLELFALTVGVLAWIKRFENGRIYIYSVIISVLYT